MTPEERKEAIEHQANRVIKLAELSAEREEDVEEWLNAEYNKYIDGYCSGFVEGLKIYHTVVDGK
jgi:hypothetical protein